MALIPKQIVGAQIQLTDQNGQTYTVLGNVTFDWSVSGAETPPANPTNHRRALALMKLLPVLSKKVPYPCECRTLDTKTEFLDWVIIHLNDVDRWDRDRIADWLDTLSLDLTLKDTTKE
jgi:hypothetical protein